MASIRGLAKCIGLSGEVSIIRDFYGYTRAPRPLSLLRQVRLLQGRHIHLNLILVGIESFTAANKQEIDAAVQFMRDTYATVGIGIGRVERFKITTAQANGLENIDSEDEADALTDEWSVPNDALDSFFVLTYADFPTGSSPLEGPCDKGGKEDDGLVVAIEGLGNETGYVLAHEVGHYLGLDQDFDDSHSPDPNNLMFSVVPSPVPDVGQLTGGQGGVMKLHCSMRAPCPS